MALGRIGDRSVGPQLVTASQRAEAWVRVCAIHALGLLAVPEAIPVAREALGDPAWAVRGAAADCLARVGGPDDLNRLLERLEDPHPWPRRGALHAIGQLGLTAAAPRVREELKHPVPEVRLAAVWALGCLRDDGAKEALVQMLRSLGPTPNEIPPDRGR